MTSTQTAAAHQYLTLTVGGDDYGVSVLAVREILDYGEVTRVPRAPRHIRGVMNLRGRVVPLVDLAVRLGLESAPVTPRTCVVVVEAEIQGERLVAGLVADAVSQVIELTSADIEPPPAFGSSTDAALLTGLSRAGQKFVLLLNVERVLLVDSVAVAPSPVAVDANRAPVNRRAALSRVAAALLAVSLFTPENALAQEAIKDNSFLIEEAYNQGPGVVQHINAFSRVAGGGSWIYTFTQEWPFKTQRHQLSFTLPVQSLHSAEGNETGIGDIALNYRYQAIGMEPGPLAFSPRLSVLVPSGKSKTGLGAGGFAIQANLPLSREVGSRFVTHWNAGLTRTFSANDSVGRQADTQSYSVGQSVVWLAGPKLNFLVETVWARAESVVGAGRVEQEDSAFVSPGVRWAHDFKNGLQIVPGIAFPIGIGPSRGEHSVFVYLSFEHPFRRNP